MAYLSRTCLISSARVPPRSSASSRLGWSRAPRSKAEQVLMEADSSLDHIYFPDNGVVSIVAVYADGNIIEMATIGREGCTGFQAVFGAKKSSVRLFVQIPGSAAKMPRAAFTRAMKSMPSFLSQHNQADNVSGRHDGPSVPRTYCAASLDGCRISSIASR